MSKYLILDKLDRDEVHIARCLKPGQIIECGPVKVCGPLNKTTLMCPRDGTSRECVATTESGTKPKYEQERELFCLDEFRAKLRPLTNEELDSLDTLEV